MLAAQMPSGRSAQSRKAKAPQSGIQPEMLFRCPHARMGLALFLAGVFILRPIPASAQDGSSSVHASPVASVPELPDAPQSAPPGEQSSSAAAAHSPQVQPDERKQTKRILGILPNFRSVSANTHLPAQTPKEKFIGFAQDSFDYSSFIFVGLLSVTTQLQGSTPEFHTGAPAFARYYWHNFADQTDENLWVGFLLPAALHQDARYYTLGSYTPGGGTLNRHHGFAKRAGYAFTRILITRTDSGGSSFNYSEVVGAGAAAGISNLYYPNSGRGWTKTGQRWALNVSIDAGTLIFKEFWPDLNHAIFHTR